MYPLQAISGLNPGTYTSPQWSFAGQCQGMPPLTGTKEHDMKQHHKARSLGFTVECQGCCWECWPLQKWTYSWFKKKKKSFFFHLLESGVDGFLWFGFPSRHPEACSRCFALCLWLLESWQTELPGGRGLQRTLTNFAHTSVSFSFDLFSFWSRFTLSCQVACIFVAFSNDFGTRGGVNKREGIGVSV